MRLSLITYLRLPSLCDDGLLTQVYCQTRTCSIPLPGSEAQSPRPQRILIPLAMCVPSTFLFTRRCPLAYYLYLVAYAVGPWRCSIVSLALSNGIVIVIEC